MSPVTSSTPSRPACSPFGRASDGVETYPIPRIKNIVGKSRGLYSWLPEAPRMVIRSVDLLQREHQPRDHHREVPKDAARA